MKVLHVIPSIGPARGGPSVVVRTMARCQAERGLEVHVATTDDNGPARLSTSKSIPVKEDGVTYWIFPRQTRFYLFSFPLTKWLLTHMSEYDVVHIHALFSYAPVAAALCARFEHVPYVIRPLGTLNKWGMRNRRRWLKKLSFRLIESRILRGAACVHYTSEQEASEAQQAQLDQNPLVISNPVDASSAARASGSLRITYPDLVGCTVVLFLSRLDCKKGLDLLLPAFARVRANHPDAFLLMAGDGDAPFVANLKRQALRLGLDAGIRWTGFLHGEEKRSALADADIFVLPSYSENFGVAVVEALAAGLPVIVSDQVGIHREVARAQAGLVIECSVEQLESALVKAITDKQFRAEMSANAVELSRQFVPEIVTQQLIETYARICSKRVRPIAA